MTIRRRAVAMEPSTAITAVIICRDGGVGLRAALDSVAFCAERLVLDSGSTDGSPDVARAAGARVEFQPFLGYGPQKRRAVALATHDWILSLDADEHLDAAAVAAISGLPLDDPEVAYALRRRTFVGRREIHHGPWGGERVVRLFNRRTADFALLPVHEQVRAPHAPVPLGGSILHDSFPSIGDVLVRSVRYARPKAAMIRATGERPRAWALPGRALGAFAKAYLLQSGWRDGTAGLVIAVARVVDSVLPRAMILLGEEDAGQDCRAAANSPAMSAGSGAARSSRTPDRG